MNSGMWHVYFQNCRDVGTSSTLVRARVVKTGSGVDTSKGRKCLRCRKCIVSTNYDKYLRS